MLRTLRWTLAMAAVVLLAMVACFGGMELAYARRIATAAQVPPAPVAIVFGAGLSAAGKPSPLLAARVRTAVALYQQGKVRKVLLTGESERHHDEIRAMRQLAQASGLPGQAILMDVEGLSTFDSCERAKKVFGVNRAILVTQRFHMSRALFVANHLGIDAWGVVPPSAARSRPQNVLRELLSRPLALLMVAFAGS